MSFYANYLQELNGDQVVETEKGFATYRFLPEKTVYIVDIYVHPDYRKEGHASALADSIVAIAKKRGCTELLGSVAPSNKGSTSSLKVLLAYGFSLKSSMDNFIILSKEI